jgi:hypothetical protein
MRALRPLIIALVLLVALDLALGLPALRRAPNDVRIPKISTAGLDEQSDAMTVDDAVSVAVVGDSVVQGLFAKRNETLPYYLDRIYRTQGRPVRVYNLGMSAAHGLELLAATDRATRLGHADVVILTFNYAFYSGEKTSARYPWLYDDPSWLGKYANDPAVQRTVASRQGSKTPVERAEQVAESAWRFYRTRGYWDAVFFDGTPGSELQQIVDNWRAKAAKTYRAPRKLKPNELKGDDVRRTFNVPELSSQHEDARLFLDAVELARSNGARVVVVVNPINRTGLRYHNALDEARFARNLAWVKSGVEARGGEFYDLSAGFPDELIADSVHPLPAGYKLMASKIAERIDPDVKAAEARLKAAGR